MTIAETQLSNNYNCLIWFFAGYIRLDHKTLLNFDKTNYKPTMRFYKYNVSIIINNKSNEYFLLFGRQNPETNWHPSPCNSKVLPLN